MTDYDRLVHRMRVGTVKMLAPGEVALLFGVNRKTVANWAITGRLPHLRTLGGHRRFFVTAVLERLDTKESA